MLVTSLDTTKAVESTSIETGPTARSSRAHIDTGRDVQRPLRIRHERAQRRSGQRRT